MRIVLVDLPFMSVHRPSLALTLLQGALRQAGQQCDICYAKLKFASQIGVELYRVISEQLPQELLIGDFLFGESLAPDDDGRSFIENARHRSRGRVPEQLWALLPELRAHATTFLTDLAPRISGYDLVGLNLTFQISPAVSFARLLKQCNPNLPVVLGGGNCEDEMGLALHRAFPWIDFVSRGEGERLIVQLAHVLEGSSRPEAQAIFPMLHGGASLSGIQGLVWRRGNETVANGNRAANIEHLDTLPAPDYSDYFDQLDSSGIGLERAELSVPFETSRGCWFGAKSHCTFCGLNGPSLAFRSKTPARVLGELRAIGRHGVPNADAVDLILDTKYFDTLLPDLAREGLPLAIFFELKSNLTRAQVHKLSAAGFSLVQPGIESLSSPVLALMRKGVSAYQNVRLLKWLAEAAIGVQWNLLYGFPMEDPAEYGRMAELVPRLVHLQPPAGGCMRVLLNRFSPLYFDAERLGVRNIRAVNGYREIFGNWVQDPEQLAYYFDFEAAGGPGGFPYVEALRQSVARWREWYGKAAFTMLDRAETLHLYDTRPETRTQTAQLTGTDRLIYLACDDGASPAALCRNTGLDREIVLRALERFAEQNWIVYLDGRYLSLAVSMNHAVPENAPPTLWQAISGARYKQMANFFVAQERQANFVPERLSVSGALRTEAALSRK